MEIISKLHHLDELKEIVELKDRQLKDLKKEVEDLEIEIAEEAQNAMMHEITSGGIRYKIGFEQSFYEIKTNSDHSKMVDLYKRLAEMGHADDFQFFETGNIHRTKFKKILSELPHEVIEQYVKDGILNVYKVPKISRRKVKS